MSREPTVTDYEAPDAPDFERINAVLHTAWLRSIKSPLSPQLVPHEIAVRDRFGEAFDLVGLLLRAAGFSTRQLMTAQQFMLRRHEYTYYAVALAYEAALYAHYRLRFRDVLWLMLKFDVCCDRPDVYSNFGIAFMLVDRLEAHYKARNTRRSDG